MSSGGIRLIPIRLSAGVPYHPSIPEVRKRGSLAGQDEPNPDENAPEWTGHSLNGPDPSQALTVLPVRRRRTVGRMPPFS